MINDEERSGCNESIIRGLLTTSAFRMRKAKQYPEDLRNARAAASLKHLANDAADYVDDSWKMLQNYYHPDSEAWRDAICQATKDVGFSNTSRSFPYFLTKLVGLLSQSQSVVA
jgi:hypothetical protein